MHSVVRWLLVAGGSFASLVGAQSASDEAFVPPDGLRVLMVTWRGCEEACRGFLDYVAGWDAEVSVIMRDADTDASRLAEFVAEVDELRPDLMVTWGTSVTLGMIGTLDDDEGPFVTDVPTVFMIVADPVGARIVESYQRSGRRYVTGTRNRVPEETQLRVISEYLPVERIGLVYNDNEVNAVLNAAEIRRLASERDIEVFERVLANDASGAPLVDDIPQAMADMARNGVDILYVGSSSFIIANAEAFTASALEHGLPVATAYEALVRDAHALIAVASPYYNVGQLAGYQAERILLQGRTPGELEILGLDRFTVLVNLESAKALELYPPLLVLRYAEVVERP